jgi:GntR family transcriptional repressor for pyruvate dehydrogenase complex
VTGEGAAGLEKAEVSREWIQPIRTPRAFEEILDQLEQALLSGHLEAGRRLPSERDFAAALGVSRTSVREAIRVMEALGLVDINRGPAGAVLRSEPGNAFAKILRLHLALDHFSWASIVELREILEGWAFAEAARRADRRLLSELAQLITKMTEQGVDPPTFLELDVAFHAAVVSASGNELAVGILAGCGTLVRKGMFEGITAGAWPETLQRLIEDHRRLHQLISQKEVDLASLFVREHIRRWNLPSAGSAAGNRGSVDGRESQR